MADTRKDLDTALQVYQGLAEDVAGIIDELPPETPTEWEESIQPRWRSRCAATG